MGELQGSTCAAGAAAGAASAAFAGYIKGTEADPNDFIDEAHLIAGIAAAFTGAGVSEVMTAAGIGQSAFENNYLYHEEDKRRSEVIDALDQCLDNLGTCSPSEIDALRDELVALNKLDSDRDVALDAACRGGASTQACQAELTKLQDAFESYSDALKSREVFKDGTLSEALQVSGQFGELSSTAMSEAAREALVEMAVDTVTGLVDLTSIAALALAGDEQAILQMGMIADQLQAMVSDPIGTTEAGIAAELARADVLEAQGNLYEANKIRSTVFMSGAFAVAGIPGAISATSAGIKVAVKAGTSVKVAEFIADETGSLKITGGGAAKGGELSGKKSTTTSSDPEAIRGINRENEAAQILADDGKDIVQNPGTNSAGKNPDLTINDEVFDVYSPSSSSPRNLGSNIQEKVDSGQTENVVVNLADSSVSPDQLTQQLNDYPIAGLKSVLIIDQSGTVLPEINFD